MLRTWTVVMLLLIISTCPLEAEILGVASMTHSYRMRQIEPLSGIVLFEVAEVDREFGMQWFVRLFNQVEIDSSCVDSTFTSTKSTDGSAFVDAAARLTDGREIWMGIGYRSEFSPQIICFRTVQDLFSLERANFAGAEIESISLRIDEISTGCSDGVTCVTVTGTITVEGDSYPDPVENTTWGRVKFLFVDG